MNHYYRFAPDAGSNYSQEDGGGYYVATDAQEAEIQAVDDESATWQEYVVALVTVCSRYGFDAGNIVEHLEWTRPAVMA